MQYRTSFLNTIEEFHKSFSSLVQLGYTPCVSDSDFEDWAKHWLNDGKYSLVLYTKGAHEFSGTIYNKNIQNASPIFNYPIIVDESEKFWSD